ncbi:hypothetical protein J5U22_01828 [Saccharolobus shibatae]|uniref:Uncharacterized protein n=1 Tax=Saccharolobus shibatae TaxID=2286 RepID=A0A8F5GZN1_9CREN|nr:hypothetical protein J5U21_01906 [Saccharolobus shibatae]QXJ35281.1 hypothetical protein J5U22_01828 [Saccharolobus shibatae]
MDYYFPWNSSKFTLIRWLSTFFLITYSHPNVHVRQIVDNRLKYFK